MDVSALLEMGQSLLRKFSSKSMCEAEIFLQAKRIKNLVRSRGRMEESMTTLISGCALRILKKEEYTFCYKAGWEGLEKWAELADRNACRAKGDQWVFPEGKTEILSKGDFYDKSISTLSEKERVALLERMEWKAREGYEKIIDIVSSSYEEEEGVNFILNTKGIERLWRETRFSLYLEVMSQGKGGPQSGFDTTEERTFNALSPEKVGRRAGWHAASLLGKKETVRGRMPLILEPSVGCGFLALIAPGLCADKVRKGKSVFKRLQGKKVASSDLNLIDDGTLIEPGGAPFDAAGTPQVRTTVIEKGRLKNFLYDTAQAKKGKRESTGNARRDSFKDIPGIGPSCLFIDNGGIKNGRDIVKEVKKGIYIFETLGLHTVDTVSGDFSIGAAGMIVENGAFTRPVKGITMAGNLLDFLSSIEMIGNDLEFYGRFGTPTLLVNNTIIGS